jgi:hypothetical protein
LTSSVFQSQTVYASLVRSHPERTRKSEEFAMVVTRTLYALAAYLTQFTIPFIALACFSAGSFRV